MTILIYDLVQSTTQRIHHESFGHLYCGGRAMMSEHLLNPEYAFCRRLLNEKGEVVGYHLQPLFCILGTQVGELLLLDEKLPEDYVVRVRLPLDGNNLLNDPNTGSWEEIDDFEVTTQNIPKRRRFPCNAEFVKEWERLAPEEIAPFLESKGLPHVEADATWGWSAQTLALSWSDLDTEDRILSVLGLFKGAHFRHFGNPSSVFSADGAGWPIADRALQTLSTTDKKGFDAFDLDNCVDVAGAVNTLSNCALLAKLCSITSEQAAALECNLSALGPLAPQSTRFQTQARAWRGETQSGRAVRCLGSMYIGKKILSFINVSGDAAPNEPVMLNGRIVGRIACTLWKMNDHWGYLRPEEQRSISILLT